MSIQYKWYVEKLDCIPLVGDLKKVVSNVHWKYAGFDEEQYSGTKYGIIAIGSPNPESFVSFNQLDEQTVINWVSSQFTDNDIQTMQSEIAQEISELKSPSIENEDLPWKNQE